MTLIIEKPTTSKLILAKDYVGIDDPDAAVYIAAVEAADEAESPGVGSLETATKVAIHSFVKGCKNDGIWPAIKASCILAGARTLTGALVPLVGTAPTNFNFVSGDYNRKTGLVGNGSTKYLNSNRAGNADPQNSAHIAVYASTVSANTTRTFIGTTAAANGQTIINGVNDGTLFCRSRSTDSISPPNISGQGNTTGFKGAARTSSSQANARSGGASYTQDQTSSAPTAENYGIFARTPSSPALYSSDRLAFYSIGESLDLALLDARVTTLISAIGAAIP